MRTENFTPLQRALGRAASWAAAALGCLYLVTLALGLFALKSPNDPIGDPYFSILELLIVLMAPLMVLSMAAVHAYSSLQIKAYSQAALVFMILAAGITSCVHFAILAASRPLEAAGLAGAPLLFSFRWPSVAYVLDILAWDWFFALSMLLAAPVFSGNRLERTVRWLMACSGVLSLAGLIGVPLADMQVRMIGVVSYAVVAPVVFLLLGMVFHRARPVPGSSNE
jgi:hypothetical protein